MELCACFLRFQWVWQGCWDAVNSDPIRAMYWAVAGEVLPPILDGGYAATTPVFFEILAISHDVLPRL